MQRPRDRGSEALPFQGTWGKPMRRAETERVAWEETTEAHGEDSVFIFRALEGTERFYFRETDWEQHFQMTVPVKVWRMD